MKKLLLLVVFACFLASCNVTESIVFDQDGSGEYLVTYEMGEAIKAMSEAMGGSNEKKEGGEVMDTVMVFADIMETYKDSIAALPEDKQQAFESIKDMYMRMKIDEDKSIMDIGMGLNFESIDDLKDINEKLKSIQSINEQGDQIDAIRDSSPLGNFMGSDNAIMYDYSDKGFSRKTKIELEEGQAETAMEALFDEADEENQQFIEYFEEADYTVKLTFPKAVKTIDIEGAKFSADRKTVTYTSNWVEYLKNPKLLDVNVTFVDE
ncbi:hypothetical protein [Winogradskyella tangerina]|uniref:hypothetical protein n=1 Tax=Winogradskyella tangerina TaxID=2023240 RepID=UPI000DBE02C8|nr:hypothetical protein [Winogradskyella tangerina]